MRLWEGLFRSPHLLSICIFSAWAAPCPAIAQDTSASGFTSVDKLSREGITIALSARPVEAAASDSAKLASDKLREQINYLLRFTVTDTSSGQPVRGSNLAAWMDRNSSGSVDPAACGKRIRTLLEGSFFSRATVDLNVYHVLVMNQDATLTVVDPLFGFGNTKLLAIVPLKSPGEDWALTSDQDRLFVSQPAAKAIAVVDAVSWKVLADIPAEGTPSLVRLQPDERRVWILVRDRERAASGVLVIDRSDLRIAARIPLGPDPSGLVLSSDNRFAFVLDRTARTVSIIEVDSLKKVAELPVGSIPVAVSFSPLSQMAYVSGADGSVTMIDGARRAAIHSVTVEPGIGEVSFAPGGRWGFIVNPEKNLLHILDASSDRILRTGAIDKAPERTYFSNSLAFIERRDSEVVLMIALTDVANNGGGNDDRPFSPADFPAGQHAFAAASKPGVAARIVSAPGENAVLVANPADKTVYYYEEGMAAPQGQFSNYGREARAVLVVDHSLRQRSPGVFETTARIPRAGEYTVPLALASPALAICLKASVEPDPDLAAVSAAPDPARVEAMLPKRELIAGQPLRIRFRLLDPRTGEPYRDGSAARVLTVLSPGRYQSRDLAKYEGAGVYSLDFTPLHAGSWLVFVECPEHGLAFGAAGSFSIEVRALAREAK